ncbi:MAG: phosphopyruvate hydratase [Nanoarchaeota archaeon]
MKILDIKAREILDSRGNPTVEVDVTTRQGIFTSAVPSGASTGIHEALELRDGGKRYLGKGVLKAVANVNGPIRKNLIGANCTNQQLIDDVLLTIDNTINKSKLGANAILGVSMAACRAGAAAKGLPLYGYIASHFGRKAHGRHIIPIPAFNIINGGAHAGNRLDFQEYMLWPAKARSYEEGLRIGSEVFHELKTILNKKYGKTATNVGDEGGFAPPLKRAVEPISLILKAADNLGYESKIRLGLDCAASQFWDGDHYVFDGKKLSADRLSDFYESLAKSYPIISIEDPFHEEAFEDYASLKSSLPKSVQIVGDDLLCTNISRMCQAIEHRSVSALLLKVNQIGSVSESLAAAQLAKSEGWGVMVSHRSGETCDDFIADLSVGLSMGQLKSGAPCRGERLAKYNRLLRIGKELGSRAVYGLR